MNSGRPDPPQHPQSPVRQGVQADPDIFIWTSILPYDFYGKNGKRPETIAPQHFRRVQPFMTLESAYAKDMVSTHPLHVRKPFSADERMATEIIFGAWPKSGMKHRSPRPPGSGRECGRSIIADRRRCKTARASPDAVTATQARTPSTMRSISDRNIGGHLLADGQNRAGRKMRPARQRVIVAAQWSSFSISSSYSFASSISSISARSLGRTRKIQPSPKASSLMVSGLSLSSSLTSTISPEIGE